MTHEEEQVLWDKILFALREKYSGANPEIIEVLPNQPITFHIKDVEGKLSFYSVNYKIKKSGGLAIDWSTVEQIDPY